MNTKKEYARPSGWSIHNFRPCVTGLAEGLIRESELVSDRNFEIEFLDPRAATLRLDSVHPDLAKNRAGLGLGQSVIYSCLNTASISESVLSGSAPPSYFMFLFAVCHMRFNAGALVA
jgi:hypothetical protein